MKNAKALNISPSKTMDNKCEKCFDTPGWIIEKKDGISRAKRCTCFYKNIKNIVLGERYKNCLLSTYKPQNKTQAKIMKAIKANPKGSYFLFGDYRSGKTHLMASQFASLLIEEKLANARWVEEVRLIKELRQKQIEDYYQPCVDIVSVEKANFLHLFIDDLGKTKPTEFVRQELYCLLNAVYKRNFCLSITSNFSLEVLGQEDFLGGAIVRRIEDICQEGIYSLN